MLTKTSPGLSECQGSLRKLKRAWKRPAQKVDSRKGWGRKSERENKKCTKGTKMEEQSEEMSLFYFNKPTNIKEFSIWRIGKNRCPSQASHTPKQSKYFFQLADWAKSEALAHHAAEEGGKPHTSLGYRLAHKIVLSKVIFRFMIISGGVIWKVHDALGMDQGQKNGYAIGW